MNRQLCMTIGPAGVKAMTVQLISQLVKDGVVVGSQLATAHVVPGRNTAWAAAVCTQAERVLWLDADVYARPEDVASFIERADAAFEADPLLAWRGALCVRRGGEELAMHETDDGRILLGLGLGYWHVPRMIEAFTKTRKNPRMPFRWIHPHSEDMDAAIAVYRGGFKCDYDPTIATNHDGVGEWEGIPHGEPFFGAYEPRDDDDRRPIAKLVPTKCHECGGEGSHEDGCIVAGKVA